MVLSNLLFFRERLIRQCDLSSSSNILTPAFCTIYSPLHSERGRG
ncbi:hypothetical protein HMPREF0973_02562 [Prevotella veroralis F0319]|uniref:Uncharacterized protein n=1 Tax=Prevotella veroralis F0319 TaxID=649761 RepID=C9MSE3_9BACT|nr:hypothetical protein HMPREF0973_02562 [Prevotella veroralis F0319]